MRAWNIVLGMALSTAEPVMVRAASVAEGAGPSDPEIIVTAGKRQQPLHDVPSSISALSGERLEQLGASMFEDYAGFIPGLSTLSIGGPGQRNLHLRGISAGDDPAATVGVYVDDVPVGSSSAVGGGGRLALDLVPFDLERVEVLRGPHGTLYGASTLGGLFKYVTRAPNSRSTELRMEADLFDVDHGGTSWSVKAMANVPIATDIAALRVTGYHVDNAGWIDNVQLGQRDVNANRISGGRAALLLQPTVDLTIRLSAQLQDIKTHDAAQVDLDSATGTPRVGAFAKARTIANSLDQAYRQYAGLLDYDAGFARLTAITSYATLRSDIVRDISPTFSQLAGGVPVAFGHDLETRKFVQEVRLASPSTRRFEWLLGLFYTHEESDNAQRYRTLGGPFAALNPVGSADLPSHYKEYAAFGEVTANFGQRFDVTLGARWSRNEQGATQVTGGVLSGVPVGQFLTDSAQSDDDIVTYVVAPRFRLSDDVLLYARAASGYRAGGPNAVLPPAFTGGILIPKTFDPDTVWNYELGLKAMLLEQRLTLGVATFIVDWRKVQLLQQIQGLYFRTNGGKAESRGLEVEARYAATNNLQLGGSLAYMDATLREDTPASVGGRAGDRLPLVPRWTAAAFADYSFPLAGNMTGLIGASYRFVGQRPSSFAASPSNPSVMLNHYETLDLRAGIRTGPLTLTVFGRNLTKSIAELSALATGPLTALSVGRPRTIGVSVATAF